MSVFFFEVCDDVFSCSEEREEGFFGFFFREVGTSMEAGDFSLERSESVFFLEGEADFGRLKRRGDRVEKTFFLKEVGGAAAAVFCPGGVAIFLAGLTAGVRGGDFFLGEREEAAFSLTGDESTLFLEEGCGGEEGFCSEPGEVYEPGEV